MGETGDHCAKWNKPDTEGQESHGLTHVESETVDLMEVGSRMAVSGSRE
jgi:hypothetical protein